MRKYLIPILLSAAVGMGLMSAAHAQIGAKAHAIGEFSEITVDFVITPTSVNLESQPTETDASGTWQGGPGPAFSDPIDVPSACDSSLGDNLGLCPGNNFGFAADEIDFDENNTQVLDFNPGVNDEDDEFGRGDALIVLPTDVATNQAFSVAEAHCYTEGHRAQGDSGVSQDFTFTFAGDPTEMSFAWNYNLALRAWQEGGEPGTGGNAEADSEVNIQIVETDTSVVVFNSNPAELNGQAAAPLPGDFGRFPVPAASGVGVPFSLITTGVFLEPETRYTISINARVRAFVECPRQTPPGVHKWYFGKQASVRPADEPLMQPAGIVTLNDQFASRDVDVRFIRGLWNPAGKNALVDPVRDDHHTCYEIVTLPGQGLQIFDVDIETANFGEDSFTLGRPKQLCISAAKTFNGVTEGSPVGTDYLCYTANSDAEGEFTLNDQFDDEVVNVTRLSRFCTPVGKNQPAPPTDPAEFDHLACYDFAEPILDPFITVGVDDQFTIAQGFDPLTFWAEKPERFCEPARKIAVTPRF